MATNKKNDKIKLVIYNEHAFGYINPETPKSFFVLSDNLTKGSSFGFGGSSTYIGSKDTIRPVTLKDFEEYRMYFPQYLESDYEWDKPTKKEIENYKSKTMATKKKTTRKKGLGNPRIEVPMCYRTNPDGSTTIYRPSLNNDRPCPYGGTVRQPKTVASASLGKPVKKKKTTSAKSLCRKVVSVPGINKRTGQLLKGWKYQNGVPVKVAACKTNTKTTKKATVKQKPKPKSNFIAI